VNAYECTRRRNGKKKMLTLVHKCNVLTHCGDLWVDSAYRPGRGDPEVFGVHGGRSALTRVITQFEKPGQSEIVRHCSMACAAMAVAWSAAEISPPFS